MFNEKHYVPLLKTKKGEFEALREISAIIRDGLTPLFEVVSIPEDENIDLHLHDLTDKIINSWIILDRYVFIDISNIDDDERMNNGDHFLKFIFDDARAKGLKLIPVTNFNHDTAFQTEIINIHRQDNCGACLRFDIDDILLSSFNTDLTNLIHTLNIPLDQIDFIIDARSFSDDQLQVMIFTLTSIINSLQNITQYRTFTLLGTSFPFDLREVSTNSIQTLPRTEWSLWSNIANSYIANKASILRMPSFGDYPISHTDISDLDPRLMSPSAAIRYTITNGWLILKGVSVRLKTGGKFGQFRNLSTMLIARPEYSGRAFSWGDNYIYECANNISGTGNLTTWRKVGTNHHLTFVGTDISNFPGL